MARLKRLLLLLNVVGLVAACGNSESQPLKGASDPSAQAAAGAKQESKYSTRQQHWVGDSDYKGELIGNPATQLPDQCVYVMPNPRSHLIDHFIDNTPPEHIPLTNWKYDFIAGELALDSLDFEEAKKMFLMALAEAQKEPKDSGNYHATLADVHLAYIARKQGDTQQAERMYKQALNELPAADEQANKAHDLVLQELALLSWKQHKLADAEHYLKQRVEIKESLSGPIGPELASAQNDLANTLYYQNKLVEADKLYKQCLLVAERFTDDTNHSLQAAGNLANCRFAQHKYADALALYGRLSRSVSAVKYMEQCREALAALPPDARKESDMPPPVGDPDVLKLLIKAAKINIDHKRTWDSTRILKAAKKEALAIGKPSLIAETEIISADADFSTGNYRQAESSYQQALDKIAASGESGASGIISAARARLLLCQIANSDQSGAEKSLAELRGTKDKKVWADSVAIIQTMFESHRLHSNDKQLCSVLANICNLCVENAPDNSMAKALALANLARTYQLSRDTLKSEPLFNQALTVAEKARDKDPEQLINIKTDLGMVYMYNQRFKDAEPLLLEAMSYAEKNPGKDKKKLRSSVQLVTALYSNWQRPDKEEFYYKRGQELRPESSQSYNALEKMSDLSNLASMASKRCDYAKASAYLEEALALQAQSRQESSSTQRELVSIYQRCGQYAKQQSLQQKIAQQIASPADRSRMQALYAASQAAFKCGDYAGSLKLVQTVISEMELKGEKTDHFYGCYYDEPRYTSCLFMIANCILDGEHNYDKAIVSFDRAIQANNPASNSPACPPPRARGELIASGPVPLDTQQLVNMLICCDAVGNTTRADDYRKQLKDKIDQSNTAQMRQTVNKHNPAFEKAIALVNKKKRTVEDELELMELLPQSLHAAGINSGQAEGAELLERAIVAREKTGAAADQAKISDDYAKLAGIYMDNRNFEPAEPLSMRRLAWLKKHSASPKELCVAEIDYADVLKERGYSAIARNIYKDQLAHLQLLSENARFELYTSLASVSQRLEEYSEELGYLNAALKLVPPETANWRQTTTVLATVNDIIGKHSEAALLYKKAANGTSDIYAVLEPLRNASDHAAEKKQYALGDYLYRRQIELLSAGDSKGVGVANAWMQMARMYRWAKMREKSRSAYEQAIAFCKSHAADQGQIPTAQQELAELMRQPD